VGRAFIAVVAIFVVLFLIRLALFKLRG